uniref:Uncharacterized protein n=1 Tax=Falco tinnunculus TaxID=100819 RepID=A0A8C4UUE2_FALTI
MLFLELWVFLRTPKSIGICLPISVSTRRYLICVSLVCFQAMAVVDAFRGLDKYIERSTKRWKKWDNTFIIFLTITIVAVFQHNIHLVAKWLGTLEKLLEQYSEKSHPDFHVCVSAEPAPTPEEHVIPQGTVGNSITITSEPPVGMLANLHAALYSSDQDTLELCTGEGEFESVLFPLCCFHIAFDAFCSPGWVPRGDLCSLFSEIMYVGHITDAWNRRLRCMYLQELISPPALLGELAVAPGFFTPSNLDYAGHHEYTDEMLPSESAVLYGLHPNAEMGDLTATPDNLFKTLGNATHEFIHRRQIRPVCRGKGKVKNILDDILEMLPKKFNVAEIMQKTTARSPYSLVCPQDRERMNLLAEIHSWTSGELMFSPRMEVLQSTLFYDAVPDTWTELGYPSTYSRSYCLFSFRVADLLMQHRERDIWTQDLVPPAGVRFCLCFFFFFKCVMQSMARQNSWPLDKICLTADVTKKTTDYGHPPWERGGLRSGDIQLETTVEAQLKELTPATPFVFVRLLPVDRRETKEVYECLKPAKWVLAGVVLLLAL